MQQDILARARLIGCAIATAREGLSDKDDAALIEAAIEMLKARRKDAKIMTLKAQQTLRLAVQ